MTIVDQGTGLRLFSVRGGRRGRRLVVWVSLALVLLAALAAIVMMQGIDRQLGDVNATYAKRNEARELTNALGQAEASQRGYLITQDDEFLVPYREAASSISQSVQSLLDLTANDRGQSARLESVTGDIRGKLVEMERVVQLVSEGRQDEAQRLVETGMGARLTAEVRETLEDFIAEENGQLAARNEAIDRTRFGLIIALIAALGSAVILAYTLLTRTQRQVSDLTQRHQGLLNENEALEHEVAERTSAIEEARAHAERERERVETLLQDTNHRIGNSLATVSSLLALQLMRTKSEEVKAALEAARLRVHAIASAHRRLRLGDDLETASADEFLASVLDDLVTTQADPDRVEVTGEIDEIEVSARDATTVGILVAELVTNALKHAFPEGRAGRIIVALTRNGEGVPVLTVSDNGVGLPTGQGNETGLGSVIVKQLSAQFGGEPIYAAGVDGGVIVTIALPQIDKSSQTDGAQH